MKLVSWIAALLAAATLLPAAETPTATGQDMKIKVAVFDFSTIDTVGQKFYRYTEGSLIRFIRSRSSCRSSNVALFSNSRTSPSIRSSMVP